MTGFAKFNPNHDAKGRFGSGSGGGPTTVSLQNPDGTWGGHFSRPDTAGKAASDYDIYNPGPVGVRNTEVASRISPSRSEGESDTLSRITGQPMHVTSHSAVYTDPQGGKHSMRLEQSVIEASNSGPALHSDRVTVGEEISYVTGKGITGRTSSGHEGIMMAVGRGSYDPLTDPKAKEISWIETGAGYRGNGIATAMVEFSRRESPIPVEHSTTLTDDGEKFTQQVKSFYQTGVTKDVGGDIHVDSLLGSVSVGPKKKRKKPKHDGEMRVEKFNHTHDGLGRFGTGSGGSSDAGWTTEQSPMKDWVAHNDGARRESRKADLNTAASSTRAALVKSGVPVVPVKMVGKPIGDHAMVAYYQLDNPGVLTMNQTSRLGTDSFFGVHEYGHLLDVEHFKSRSQFATGDPGSKVAGVMDKINATPQANVWKYASNGEYWGKPSEMFARAFAQYVATKSGDPKMLKTMKSQASAQWPEADFAPISAEFDNVFAAPVVKVFYMTGFEKFNQNHDGLGRFSTGAGGSGGGVATAEMQAQLDSYYGPNSDKIDWENNPPRRVPFGNAYETPAMHAQNAERWANTVAARQHKDALRALEHSAAVHVAADSVHSQAVQNEPAITSQMKELAGAHGAQLVGLEFRIKAPGSLGRKISADAKVENITPADAAANISDSVRYTMKLPARKYTSGARKTIGELQAKGYNLNVKNYWKPGDPYQGINVAAVAPTGQKFELQFHTAKSFKVKEAVLHPMYEEFRVAEDPSTRNTLWGKMVDAAASIPIPAGVESIPPLKTQSMG